MTDEEFETYLDQARLELQEKQDQLGQEYELGTHARWWFEQETGTLQFFDADDRLRVEAAVVDIGSYSSKSNSWKWSWCNPSVLPWLQQKAEPLKELEHMTGLQLFGRDTAFTIDGEGMAWEFAALAVKQLGALGCYRAPSSRPEGLQIFLVITNIRRLGDRTL